MVPCFTKENRTITTVKNSPDMENFYFDKISKKYRVRKNIYDTMAQQEKRYVTHFFTTGRNPLGGYKKISFITRLGEKDGPDAIYYKGCSLAKDAKLSQAIVDIKVRDKTLTPLPVPVEIKYGECLYIEPDNGYILLLDTSPRKFFIKFGDQIEDFKIGEVPIDREHRTY